MPGDICSSFSASLYYLFFQFAGICISARALKKHGLLSKLTIGSVTGSVFMQWMPIPFAFFFGFSVSSHLLALLPMMLMCLFAMSHWRTDMKFLLKPRRLFLNRFYLFIAATILLFIFLTLHSFRIKDGEILSSQATYGDMSMHLSFITSLSTQQSFPPEYSLLPGTKLSYPFLSDSISASLHLLGMPLRIAYVFPMFFAGAQVFTGFYLFAMRWLKDRRKSAFAYLLFFFNGGLGFVYFINNPKMNLRSMLTEFYQTPTNLFEHGIRWVNVMIDMMLPQRATLFGWAVLVSCMYLLYCACFQKQRELFPYAAILLGLLPMIHMHSLLFAFILCLCWLSAEIISKFRLAPLVSRFGKGFVICFVVAMSIALPITRRIPENNSKAPIYALLSIVVFFCIFLVLFLCRYCIQGGLKRMASTWGILLIIVLALALPQMIFWTFTQSSNTGFIQPHLNWANENDAYVWFYIKNLGLPCFLAFIAIMFAKESDFLKFSPAVLAWVVAELIRLQPNPYDNNKLLYPAYMLTCCLISQVTVNLWRKIRQKPMAYPLAGLTIGICMLSACLTIVRESVSVYTLFPANAIALSDYIRENTAVDAIVLTDFRHNNEVASLAGRNIVCGSGAYLFYHGLDYAYAESAVSKIYRNPAGSSDLIHNLKIDYILISDHERIHFHPNEKIFAQLFTCVYNKGEIQLYAVRTAIQP